VSGRQIDSLGRSQVLRKPNQAEIDRRDVWIAKLFNKGHTTVEIATALGMSRTTVGIRLSALNPGRTKRPKGRGPVTYACPWRDEDVGPEDRLVQESGSRWRQSKIIGMAQMLNDEYRESNFSNILANQATAAEEGGDHDWLIEALAVVSAAMEKLERARRVLTDDHYRVACRDTLEGVEQMRLKHPPLRSVLDSRVV
jgi:hypothetical protein